MKKLILILLSFFAALSTRAIHVEYGQEVLIDQPVNEDLYVAGGTVVINAPVHGDLIVAGGTVTINDSVSNDIILAGGTVNFNGYVGDDIRCAGGTLHVSRDIAGDLVVGGGTVTIDKGVDLTNLLVSGGNVIMSGNVRDELRVAAGSLRLTGRVDGDVVCRGGTLNINGPIRGKSILSAEKIELGEKAAFYGDIRYWTKGGEMSFGAHQKEGTAVYDESLAMSRDKWMYLGFASLVWVLIYLGSALIMIWLIQYLFSATLKNAGQTMRKEPGTSLGYGFLFLVAVPVAAIIAFITLVGIPIGLLLTLGYLVLVLLATGITSLVISNWLADRRGGKRRTGYRVLIAFVLFIIFKVIGFIPVIGWLAMLVLVCLAFGAILLNIQRKWRSARLAAMPVASAPLS